ncbi:MAG: amino acid adenylation domain-containing protein [Chloroflexi bacterium]|nr:amino acid adenylation domain-containing protein [Chloroflexota bacterium]
MSEESTQLDGIAVIGMAGRFPGARNIRQFWENLCGGVESITWLADDEIESSLEWSPNDTLKHIKAAAILDEIEDFDAAFFGFNPREAEIMDPQQRLFLEAAWEALEDAGYNPMTYDGSIGLFASTQMSSYLLNNLMPHRALVESMGALTMRIANDRDFLPTRVSYKLNLRGPSIAVSTACSSSLVATHMACQSLLDFQSDIVLVGSATINVPQKAGYPYEEGGIMSPDGHCRAFDADAQGTFRGNGLGIVVLKRLDEALNDGDQIYAVIRGSATNNDGSGKVGYTAPSVDGQAGVILAAQIVADVDPTTISYVEAHGAGTPLGDPIEIAALTQAFRTATDETGFCAIGSVKTNIGHLDSTAGIAGLIKTILALKHGQLPPSLNCEQPNPAINFGSTPFYVNTELRPWDTDDMPRRAGVSSFGVGGTNAHVILEEAPAIEPSDPAQPWQLLLLSAKTAGALDSASAQLLAHLHQQPDINLADMAYTLQVGRQAFDHRQIVVCRDPADAIAVLTSRDKTRFARQERESRDVPVGFMFAGLGDHYVEMGLELYQSAPVFRATIDRCAELLKPELHPEGTRDLRDVLYPRGTAAEPQLPGSAPGAGGPTYDVSQLLGRESAQTDEVPLNRTDLAQPILFVLEYALAQQWIAWGVKPQALIGHSLGEYVAATVAGVFSLPDALRVVAARARLIHGLPGGAMLTVMLSEAELQPYLSPEIALAAVNSPLVSVVAGSPTAIDALAQQLHDEGIGTRRLATAHAFHSHLMEPILDRFVATLSGVRLHAPQIPFISNVTGTWITSAEATDPRYWARHLRQTVRFAEGVRLLWSEPGRILIEVGPGQSLSSMARQQPKQRKTDQRLALPTLRTSNDPTSDRAITLTAIGKLWLAGVPVDWAALHADERRQRVSLPTYPFERQRYWIDPPRLEPAATGASAAQPSHSTGWCSVPSWRESPLPDFQLSALAANPAAWLVITEPAAVWSALSQTVTEMLSAHGQTVHSVTSAAAPDWLAAASGPLPDAILYFWHAEPAALDQALDTLHAVAQTIAERVPAHPVRLVVVTTQLHDILGETPIDPASATLGGLCAAINAANPLVQAGTIDMAAVAARSHLLERQSRALIAEAMQPLIVPAVAYRNSKRWAQRYEPAALDELTAEPRGLRQGGVYLLTGNVDQFGAEWVAQLVQRWNARIMLVSPSSTSNGDSQPQIIEQLLPLIERQAVVVLPADLCDPDQMQALIAQAEQRYGALDGVFYGAQPGSDSHDRGIDHLVWRKSLHELSVIAEICAERSIQTVVVCVSLAGRLGTHGPSAALSSAVLDSFVQQQQLSSTAWISLAWDTTNAAEQMLAVERILAHGGISQALVAPGGLRDGEIAKTAGQARSLANTHARPDLSESYVAPRNATERLVAMVWEDLLGISPIGMDDNFFELGGHSLLATRLLGRLRELLGVDLPLNSLFVTPTIGKLAEQLAIEVQPAPGVEPMPHVPRDLPLPLSFSQQRLWLLHQIDPQDISYNMPFAVRVSGAFDGAVLMRCIQTIVDRHETLRTTFDRDDVELDGQPYQRISPSQPITLIEHDLAGRSAPDQHAELQRIVVETVRQPFALATGPLLRIGLVKLGTEDHVVYLVMHHIISDGWSMDVFVGELISLYEAFRADQPVPLPALSVQYADYAQWQRDWLRDERLAEQLKYWTQQLAGAPPLLALPTDRPRPATRSHHGRQYPVALDAALTRELKQLSQREGVTLFMTLLGAFQVLLARWSGQYDLVVGSPIAGRSRPELEKLIGFFVNTLALRTDLGGNPSFVELLGRVRETTLGAYTHQDLPFERLVEELRLERDLSYNPLIQVLCSLQNTPFTELKVPDLSVTRVELEQGVAPFDLMLALAEQNDRLEGVIEYNTDLFDRATIARVAGYFETLLSGIVAAPEQPIGTLPLLPNAERRQLLIDWNRSDADYPHATVHELFEAQAARTPDRTALVFQGASLTYAELNAQANQLVHHLRAQGVGPDVLVALYVERSLELIVGVLAILKAGGAYVPLDPSYPAERLKYMLAHSQAPIILTQNRLVDQLPEHTAQVFRLDADWPLVVGQPTTNPAHTALPDHLAYLIFTSGSTGRPKGIAMPHRALVNLMRWQLDQTVLREPARTLQFAPIGFDVSCQELLTSWGSGGTLVLISEEQRRDPVALLSVLREQQVARLFLPFVMLQQLAEAALTLDLIPDSLREIMTAGEQLQITPSIAAFFERLPGCTLHNHYGPSETHVATHETLSGPPAAWAALPPIGRPIANTQTYILDALLQPVPIGAVGELYLGGAGLARGYWNRPDLTAEKFISDPFSASPSARLYRTGDLTRYLPDGRIEFVGRIDQQVKLRGFRIELDEIAAVLATHPQVSECVVVAREDRAGDKRLVAYVTEEPRTQNLEPNGEQTNKGTREQNSFPSPAAAGEGWPAGRGEGLREFLAVRLPDYMVPSAFVLLDALPITPSGKLDRRALPAPDLEQLSQAAAFIAPRTPTEELLAGIWAQQLDRSQVSVHANFFELGGHSLLATRVVSRLRETFAIELPLRTLFEAPTLATLAQRIDQARRDSAGTLLPPLTAQPRPAELPLSFAQQRLWLLDRIAPGGAGYNLPAAIRLHGSLDLAALSGSFTAVVARHEALRTTFAQTSSGLARQVIGEPVPLQLTVIDLQDLDTADREAEALVLARAEATQPFDLSYGPLLRATLLRLATEEHVLLVTMHHIIADGWSIGVLIGELATHYRELLIGKTPSDLQAQMLPLPVQYADYTLWQRSWLRDERLAEQLSYWTRQFDPLPSMLALPTDRPRPAAQTYHGALEHFQLDAALLDGLKRLGQQQGTTLYMTLLAAFQTLLFRYSGQPDVVVGSPIAGRTQAELEKLIGFFVNTLALRTDLSGQPSFVELLRRVRETTLGAYAHQDLPFELLIDALQPERDLSHHPLFQAMFVLQNVPMPALQLDDLRLEPVELDPGIAKFDLTLTLTEIPAGLVGSFEYNTDLFERTTIERMVGHFQTLVAAIVAEPEQQIDRLPLLTEPERQLLDDWNATPAELGPERSIHDLFAEQALRTPDAIALVHAGQQLTYDQLNRRANQLAHHLGALGVGSETLVGVCLDRSFELVVALLAILKAGAVYVPLDPSYPVARLELMLADVQAPVLLTTSRHQALAQGLSTQALCLDTAAPLIEQQPQTNPLTTVHGEQLAYVIYTSGSTGRPKGVGIAHAAIAQHSVSIGQIYGLHGQDRVLQFSSPSFDVSIELMLAPLIKGACLVLRDDELWSVHQFTQAIEQAALTVVNLPPAYYREWVQAVDRNATPAPAQLRLLTVGGEALPPDAVRLWQQTDLASVQLLNAYGPTETTITATIFDLSQPATIGDTVPIGRPIGRRSAYILDAAGAIVPVGIPGELYLGGSLLARGYLNRPELTAEKFVPDPFSAIPGSRLYRTGDLVRYRADGNIEFLGRIDHQVKLRGFRIELGEIEAVLRQHPAVRDAIVLLRDEAGDQRLVAYVVENKEPGALRANKEQENHAATTDDCSVFSVLCSPQELRDFLVSRLPAYMVPAAFLFLDELPLTPSDKVDRRALAALTPEQPTPERNFVAPRTPIEETLSRICAELLAMERVGVDDNFFALGGHSLLAVQLIARIHEQLHVEIPVRTLFESPTVAGLAEYIEAAPRVGADAPATTATSGSAGEALASLSDHIEVLRLAAALQPPSAALDEDLYEDGEL